MNFKKDVKDYVSKMLDIKHMAFERRIDNICRASINHYSYELINNGSGSIYLTKNNNKIFIERNSDITANCCSFTRAFNRAEKLLEQAKEYYRTLKEIVNV